MNKEEIILKIKEKEEEKDKIIQEINELKEKLRIISNKESNNLTRDEKVEIFANYFRGRNDVYPYLSIDKNDSTKKYYRPTCVNQGKRGICKNFEGGKCKNCPYKEYKPLTLETIYNHMYNDKTIGIYPLLADETCYFLAFDFDDKKDKNNIKDDVLAFKSVCCKYEIPIAIERSRSGMGIHAWLFFKDRVEAIDARKLGRLLLSKTMEIRDNLTIESFDRMFPNQDFMPKGGFGNLIALPFQTSPAKSFNTLFLDENFIPYTNQFEYLKELKKLSKEELLDKIKTIALDTVDISNLNLDIKKETKDTYKDNFKYPKSINVTLDNMVCIEKKNLTAAVKNSFRRLAKFANPEFYQKQKARISVWNIPLVIDCSKEDDKHLKIPRGRYEYLSMLCQEKNVKMKVKDIRNSGNKIDVHFNGVLRDEQEKALKKMLEYENGILEAPTGFGKTVIGCRLIAERGVNTLIIAEKIHLLNQWEDSLKKFLDIDEVGQFGGGKKKITNIIDTASIKSIWNNGKLDDIVNNYGMIIIDECHHLAAYTYENAINAFNSKYVYGVSATPKKENGHTPIIEMQCGDIRYKVNSKEFNKNLNLSMKDLVQKVRLSFVDMSITDYSLNEINNFIAKDYIRNEKIVNDIKNEFLKGKNILVLTERLEHLNYFKDNLKKLTDNLFIYQGGLGKKKLKEYEELKKDIEHKNDSKIIIATGSYIGEGFDDPNLDVLFLTMPISGITKVTQYTGRLHRKNDSKQEIIVYDYVDENFNQTRSMFEKRKKTYKKLGYEVVEN